MQLATYLKRNGKSAAEFAVIVGASRSSISRLARGKQKPSGAMRAIIATATAGAVTERDWDKHAKINGHV